MLKYIVVNCDKNKRRPMTEARAVLFGGCSEVLLLGDKNFSPEATHAQVICKARFLPVVGRAGRQIVMGI